MCVVCDVVLYEQAYCLVDVDYDLYRDVLFQELVVLCVFLLFGQARPWESSASRAINQNPVKPAVSSRMQAGKRIAYFHRPPRSYRF